ncbi:hypothetical protein ROJ8625_01321 [Roseivivax jejudonensis]|uniref:Peptidase A2 domain-containing protein n=1 Tax=Roseivivax jejudonensis TaxID=1529041 RepID=A0A1X6YSZ2_9RHOB|nr:TIGR02281 family clan AA aspartic protease [Roseivivax jejudonensis]SLN29789.1 hypothetical protein ROJ8625_01321 [Roseivivax jejudonensis]
MTGDEIARLGYLGLLGSALIVWFLVSGRESLGQRAKQMAAWVLIFLGTIAAIGLWGDIRQTVAPQQQVMAEAGRIVLPRAADGHYYADVDVNGASLRMLVDTGASTTVLSPADARRAGLDPDGLGYYGRAMTANGEVRTAPVTLDSVAIGPVSASGVRAAVTEGEMAQSLLGMTYLQRFSRIEIAGGELVLEQ